MQLQAGAGDSCRLPRRVRIAACPPAPPSSGPWPSPACSRARRVRRSRRKVDHRGDDPPRERERLRRAPAALRREPRGAPPSVGARRRERARRAPLAGVLRAADRSADRRRDVAGARRLPRRRRATRSAPRGGRWRRSACRSSTRSCATSTATARARSAGGRGAAPSSASPITTGDLADNQQLNETRWFKGVLDGGRVDPFSGQPISATNPCGGADQATIDRLNADVAARRYTGVADYDDYPGVPADRYNGFWDPDVAPPGGGPYAAFPRYPGFLERAQAAFSGRGPEGAVVHLARQPRRADPGQRARQHRPVPVDRRRLPEGVPVRRRRPGAVRERLRERGVRADRRPVVHPDAAGRRADGPAGPGPQDHQHRRVQGRRSAARTATATSRPPSAAPPTASPPTTRSGRAPASRWSRSTPSPRAAARTATSTTRSTSGSSARCSNAQRARRLVIVYGHHTLGTMSNTRNDEQAGACDPPEDRAATPTRAARRRCTAGWPAQQERARPVPEVPERDRLRRRPHARQPRRPVPQGPRAASGRSTPRRTSTGRSRAG